MAPDPARSRMFTGLAPGLLVMVLNPAVALAGEITGTQHLSIDAGIADRHYDNTYLGGATIALPGLRWLRASRSGLRLNAIYSDGDWAARVTLGPVWRVDRVLGSRLALELSVSPTALSRTHFDGEDMGSHFHFTSSLTLAAPLGKHEIALSIQHVSNAGLSDQNPGMDLLVVSLRGLKGAADVAPVGPRMHGTPEPHTFRNMDPAPGKLLCSSRTGCGRPETATTAGFLSTTQQGLVEAKTSGQPQP